MEKSALGLKEECWEKDCEIQELQQRLSDLKDKFKDMELIKFDSDNVIDNNNVSEKLAKSEAGFKY
jgi:hypothetical protein